MPADRRVLLLTKGELGESNTRYAQCGLSAAVGEDDTPRLHEADTLAAGAGLCDPDAVRVLVDGAPQAVEWLIDIGAQFDRDATGTSAQCIPVDQAQIRLKNFTQWLRDSDNRGFLAEFGVGRDDACLQVLTAILSFLEENNDVWAGWTYWSAGPWWGNYHSTLAPTNDGQERPQMAPLRQHLQPR